MGHILLATAHLAQRATDAILAACQADGLTTEDASPGAAGVILVASLEAAALQLPLPLLRLWRSLAGQPRLLLLVDAALRAPALSQAGGQIHLLSSPWDAALIGTRLQLMLASELPAGPQLPGLSGAYVGPGIWLRCRPGSRGPHLFRWSDGGLTAVLASAATAGPAAQALAAGDWAALNYALAGAGGAIHLCPRRGWFLLPPRDAHCVLINPLRLPAVHFLEPSSAPQQLPAAPADRLWLGPVDSLPESPLTPDTLQAAAAMPTNLPYALCLEALL